MRKLYYSAAVKLENEITCIIGMSVLTNKKEIDKETMKSLYKFMVSRYFGWSSKITAFGQISRREFNNKTNLTIRTEL